MVTHFNVSVIILCLALSLSALSCCRGAVGDIATQDFFNGILSAASDGCAGKSFYTYSDFISAANSFSSFGTTGTSDDNKREKQNARYTQYITRKIDRLGTGSG